MQTGNRHADIVYYRLDTRAWNRFGLTDISRPDISPTSYRAALSDIIGLTDILTLTLRLVASDVLTDEILRIPTSSTQTIEPLDRTGDHPSTRFSLLYLLHLVE
jgi:hypothetical protein